MIIQFSKAFSSSVLKPVIHGYHITLYMRPVNHGISIELQIPLAFHSVKLLWLWSLFWEDIRVEEMIVGWYNIKSIHNLIIV